MVHSDRKGNSGLFVTMGTGAMINISKNLGVNTFSSTKKKLFLQAKDFLSASRLVILEELRDH